MDATDDPRATAAQDFAERFAVWFEEIGVTRMAGRVLGWLLVCEPAHQSADDLAEALHASRGSISTTTRMLVTAGLVERMSLPGDRRTYYRARPNWNSLLEAQHQRVIALRDLVEEGMVNLGYGASERLQGVHDFARLWEAELAVLLRGDARAPARPPSEGAS